MPLEDFEKSLVGAKKNEEKENNSHNRDESKRHHRHHRHHREHEEDDHRHKRRRRSKDDDDHNDRERGHHSKRKHHREEELTLDGANEDEDRGLRIDPATMSPSQGVAHTSFDGHVQRDLWMEEPSGLDIDDAQKGVRKPSQSITTRPPKADFKLKVHDNELNKNYLQGMADVKVMPDDIPDHSAHRGVDYRFGDAGAQWRMTKLRGIYRRATETGRSVEEVAEEQFESLQAFDEAREEQVELERRETYGEGYVGKEKPSGELFEERKLSIGIQANHTKKHGSYTESENLPRAHITPNPARFMPMDQTTLNRLKAQMMKARLRGSSDAARLEAEYNDAMIGFTNIKQPEFTVIGAMDNRMLAGGRSGEVTNIENKRGRERGLVEENEGMTIEDMVKQERRTRNQAGGDGQRFAETIVKDAKFDVSVPIPGPFAYR